jgi:hypothetical protein
MAIRLEMKIQFLQDAFGHWLNIFGDCQDCEQFLWDSKWRQSQKPGLFLCSRRFPSLQYLAALSGSQPSVFPAWPPLGLSTARVPYSGSHAPRYPISFFPVTTGAVTDHHGSGPSWPQKLHATQRTWDVHSLLMSCGWIITRSHCFFMLESTTNGNPLIKYKSWANRSGCCSQCA